MTILKMKKLGLFALVIGLIAFTFSCNRDSGKAAGSGSFEITDAPMEDANVKAVFVTVADLKVDGESVDGFSKQTIELSAFQNGKTEALYDGELEAKSYSEITLVLDYDKDEEGDSPGTYVLTKDGKKKSLNNSSNTEGEFTAKTDLTLVEDGEETVVIDFDLRKAIKYKNGSSTDYELVASNESSAVVRTVNKEESSTVKGQVEDKSQFGMNGQVIAYLYKKGEFNESSETAGESKFNGSVTSTMVGENGEYTLAFVEEGVYEIHFANYEDTDSDGKSEFKGMVSVSTLFSGGTDNIQVESKTDIELNIELLGLL